MMITNYENKKRGPTLDVPIILILEIIKDINAHIQTAALTIELTNMDEASTSIDLAQELSLKFEYLIQRKILFCGVVIWSDYINHERRIKPNGATIIPLETFLLNEMFRILQLMNKIII